MLSKTRLTLALLYSLGWLLLTSSAALAAPPTVEEDIKTIREILRTTNSCSPFIEKNGKERLETWRAAAEKGNAKAMWLLGRCYLQGVGVDKNAEQAAEWIRKSAQKGFPIAQNNLGVLHESGLGVEENVKEAISWYRKAAAQGELVAYRNLARAYEDGVGVDADLTEAVIWLRKLSDAGDGRATAKLVVLFEEGKGIDRDEKAAKRFRKKAREQLGEAADDEILCVAIQKDPLGKTAPNAQGTIEGKKFKLSDQRGKVVVLKYTATWCGPCKAMAPHLKGLVQRLKDDPFTLLDVDVDQNEALASQWGINSVPTIYVLDHTGTIRFVDVRGKELDKAVDTLLKELKEKGAREK